MKESAKIRMEKQIVIHVYEVVLVQNKKSPVLEANTIPLGYRAGKFH